MRKITLSLALLALGTAQAQLTPQDYFNRYPDEQVVLLDDRQIVEIQVKGGELEIEEINYREFLHLSNTSAANSDRSVRYTEPFYEVDDIEAYAYVVDGNEYRREKIRDFQTREIISNDVFYSGEKAITYRLPPMPKGSRSSVEYKRIIHDPKFLSSNSFKAGIITEKQTFEIIVDEDVDLEIMHMYCKPEDLNYSLEIKGSKRIHRWKVENVEKFKDESSTPSYRSFTPHIIYRIKSYKTRDGEVPVLRNVDDLYSWYSGLIEPVTKDEDPEIDSLVTHLTADASSDREKAKRIFNWVQSNIKYIAIENGLGGFVPRLPSKTFANKYGDCKDMSSLLVYMLSKAGLQAGYTWIGTRDIPYRYEEVPTPQVDNHMIACVQLDGERIFLDATSSKVPFSYPSQFIQGKEALIYQGPDKYLIAKIEEVPALRNVNEEHSTISLNEEGDISGEGRSRLSGYFAEYYGYKTGQTLDKKEIKKFIEALTYKGNNKFELEDYQVQAQEADSVALNFDFTIQDYAYSSGNELFINLNLERPYAGEKLKDDRQYPLEFKHTSQVVRTIDLNIPEGFKAKYVPKNAQYEHPYFGFEVRYEKLSNGQLRYVLVLTIDTLTLQPESFEAWNEMIEQLKSAYNESVLLEKI